MIGAALRVLTKAFSKMGTGVLKLMRGGAKSGALLAAARLPFGSLGMLGALLNKNEDIKDEGQKIDDAQQGVVSNSVERPIPKASLIVSDIKVPTFQSWPPVEVDYKKFEKDLDLESAIKPLVTRVNLIDVKIKRITRYLTSLHNRLVELEDLKRQDVLEEKLWQQETKQEQESINVFGKAFEKVGDVVGGLMHRLKRYAPLAALGIGAAGLSFSQSARAAEESGTSTGIQEFVDKIKDIASKFLESQGGVGGLYDKVENAAMQSVGVGLGFNAAQTTRFASSRMGGSVRMLQPIAIAKSSPAPAVPAVPAGGLRPVEFKAPTPKVFDAVTDVVNKIPRGDAKVGRWSQYYTAFTNRLRDFSTRIGNVVDDVKAWGNRLPPRIANIFLKGVKWVAKWGLIFNLAGGLTWNVLQYQFGAISEEKMHTENKKIINDILRLFGAPFLIAFVFSLLGSLAAPFAGTILAGLGGAAAGLVLGLWFGDDLYNVAGFSGLVDGMYDWILSGFKDTAGMTRWAIDTANRSKDAITNMIKSIIDVDVAKMGAGIRDTVFDTPMSEEKMAERYGDVSNVQILQEARTGGFARTNDENAVLGVLATVQTGEQWQQLKQEFKEQQGEELETYLQSFLSSREYSRAIEMVNNNIRKTNIESGAAQITSQDELIEYAIDKGLYERRLIRNLGFSEINRTAIESFVKDESINIINKVSTLQSMINDIAIRREDKQYIQQTINQVMADVQNIELPQGDVNIDSGVIERSLNLPQGDIDILRRVIGEREEEVFQRFDQNDMTVSVIDLALRHNDPQLYEEIQTRKQELFAQRAQGTRPYTAARSRIREEVNEEVHREYAERIVRADAGNILVDSQDVTNLYRQYVSGPNIITRTAVETNITAPTPRQDVSVIAIPAPQARPRASSTTGSYQQTGSIGTAPGRNTADRYLSPGFQT